MCETEARISNWNWRWRKGGKWREKGRLIVEDKERKEDN